MKSRLLLLLALVSIHAGYAQPQGSPFSPPRASIHYAPDRVCDLLHVSVNLKVDYPNRAISGVVTNQMRPFRSGVQDITLHAGTALTISSVKLDGRETSYRREGKQLTIENCKLTKGKAVSITIVYSGKNQKGSTFGAGGGWHWISATATNPNHVGFWTQGETEYNSEWVPTWDYPNDLATSDTTTTVPASWDVVGNGVLTSSKRSADRKTRTFTWRMTQPHATYLLSLCGGPFDIKKEVWQGVDLWYVVPKGEGHYIYPSFGHTKDMLSFFSKSLGVKYPWPKYAQNAMYDFGGGMENVSATTLGEGALTEAREGYFNMDGLNAHELAHQWFGDLVTCKDWSDIWLNESFATFFQILYTGHSRGKDAYDWDVDGAMKGYFQEAKRYKRPLSTNMYATADSMFDSHSYPKGAAILHTLRRHVGDEAFFGGLNLYLTRWRHTPVESDQLRRAMAETSGKDLEFFWDQWINKPGHPVLDYTWAYEPGKIRVTIKQVQNTSDGTPIYQLYMGLDVISPSGEKSQTFFWMTGAERVIELPASSRPGAVILDPEHSFLREIPTLHWSDAELPVIFRFARNAPDRAEAMRMMLAKPTDENVRTVAQELAKDMGRIPIFRDVTPLVNLAKPALRQFWISQLASGNFDRQAAAVQALGKLPADPTTTNRLRAFVNDKAPILVVVNAINALAAWDKKAHSALFRKALTIKDRRGQIKRAAERALS